jgi:hypothetical protein
MAFQNSATILLFNWTAHLLIWFTLSLTEVYSPRQWMERRGPIPWHLHSPDRKFEQLNLGLCKRERVQPKS